MGTVPVNPPAADPPARQLQRRDQWRLSPWLPFTAVILLTALWLLSAFGGWATAAFCSASGFGASCRAHVHGVLFAASWVASVGLTASLVGLLAPLQTRSREHTRTARMKLFTVSAALYVIALTIVFIGGQAAAS
ncbi:MAG TPA: hypothetical protein VLW50_04400 [Streptosporangiaceae bacterium]|nr:hypothetical protein [Streptosporangiaceae bacterium]